MVPKKQSAHVAINESQPPHALRLRAAKELIHVTDASGARVSTREQVDRLTSEIVLAFDVRRGLSSIGIETLSDDIGILQAAALLFPFEARETLRPAYEAGKISADEIESLVQIPISFVQLVMNEQWPDIYTKLKALPHAD